MADYLLLENGDRLLLEDGTGCLLLESSSGGAAVTLPTEAGAYALTGSAATVRQGHRLPTDAGSYVVTGSAAALRQGHLLLTVAGAYLLTGHAATLLRTKPPLAADAGAYALTGRPAGLVRAYIVPITPGSYAVTGSPADLVARRALGMTGEPGVYTVTGAAALGIVARVLAASPGAFTLTGSPVGSETGAGIVALPGAYELTGAQAGFVYSNALPVYVLREVLTRRMRRSATIADEDRWLFHRALQIDLETGVGLSTGLGRDPQVMLRWSDDGGQTWSSEHWTTAGRMGEYQTRASWQRLGRSRGRVYETTVTDPVAWNLLAAILEIEGGLH